VELSFGFGVPFLLREILNKHPCGRRKPPPPPSSQEKYPLGFLSRKAEGFFFSLPTRKLPPLVGGRVTIFFSGVVLPEFFFL